MYLKCHKRLLDPGSEWWLHRDWFKNSAMADLLGEDDSPAAKNTLYELVRTAFLLWCEKAEASGIHCLKQMAKTIRKRLEGLLAYWKHDKLTSASQEGLSNKIGWLTRQAYGYRDEKYLCLKIYDLPDLSTSRSL